MKREIITLCGSTRFKEEFREVEKMLTLEGKIVLSLGTFSKSDKEELDKDTLKNLTELHFDKIKMSDGVYIIDVDGYTGESTRSEIEYARRENKFMRYYSKERSSK